MQPPLLALSKKRPFQPHTNVMNDDTTATSTDSSTSIIAPKENTFLKKRKLSQSDQEDQIDYDTVSISNFGTAYLKGYGWKEGKGFGKREEKLVEPVSVELRPKLSGLGSLSTVSINNSSTTQPIANEKSLEYAYLNHSISNDKFTVNHLVKIIHGSYEGLFGRVLEIVSINKYKLLLQDYSTVIVKEYDLEMITELSNYNSEHLIRHFARSLEYIKIDTCITNSQKNTITNWLLPNIRVRIISKQLQFGKYYNYKGTILDIPEQYYATVKLDNSNSIIDHVHENDLETIVPKHCPCKVMIVSGKYKGYTATCINKTSQLCHVQLNNQIIELDFDAVAQVA